MKTVRVKWALRILAFALAALLGWLALLYSQQQVYFQPGRKAMQSLFASPSTNETRHVYTAKSNSSERPQDKIPRLSHSKLGRALSKMEQEEIRSQQQIYFQLGRKAMENLSSTNENRHINTAKSNSLEYPEQPQNKIPRLSHSKLGRSLSEKEREETRSQQQVQFQLGRKVMETVSSKNETRNINTSKTNISEYQDLPQDKIPRLSHPKLRRALSEKEHEEMRKLMFELDNIFTENNITYLMVYGTLLGSYFVHDILPWDDDLDLFVREPDQQRVLDLFKGSKYDHMEAYHHTGHPSKMVKIYHKHSPHAGNYLWRWPFVDVTSYTDNQDSICCIHDVKSPGNRVERSSFYPLHRRPFAGLWLPAPRDPLKFLRQKYHTFVCKSQTWNHREEKERRAERASCEQLKEYYPTVYRSPEENGVRETLKLREKVLYSVHVDEPYGGQLGPFNLGNTTKT